MPKPRKRNTGVRYSPDLRKQALKLAKRGKTVPEIVRTLSPSPSQNTVRKWITAAGLDPTPGRQRLHDRAKILRDLKAKKRDGKPRYSRAQLQEKYGCSGKFLSQLASGTLQP